jgi:hypothetical protein
MLLMMFGLATGWPGVKSPLKSLRHTTRKQTSAS